MSAAVSAGELGAWLRLLLTQGVGRASARRLLAAFGSAQSIFDASAAARRDVIGVPLAAALATPPVDLEQRLHKTQSWLADSADNRILVLGDADFPPALLDTVDPPLLLFAQGDLAWLHAPALAIVGSRNPTAQGRDNARAFAAALSDAGYVVVSGLALGIDGAAHEGALDGKSGTIAVVGTGPDRVYPARHRALAHRIVEHGVLLSEFVPGTPPLPGNFPLRNRLIAGLASGTLVVEAAVKSGSLVTARLAAEGGREVFAIPGSIHSPLSRGCHALIRQGAKLVETADDILEELGAGPARKPRVSEAAPADPLLDALGQDPVTLDALSARTGWAIDVLNVRMLELELDGRVARLPGGLFQRRFSA